MCNASRELELYQVMRADGSDKGIYKDTEIAGMLMGEVWQFVWVAVPDKCNSTQYWVS